MNDPGSSVSALFEHLIAKASPLDDGHMDVAIEDIRALKEAHEQEIRRLEAMFQATIDCVPDVLFMKSATDHAYLFANAASARAQRTTTANIRGKRQVDFFPEERAKALEARDMKILEGREVFTTVEKLPMSDLGTRTLRLTRTPIYAEDGRALYLVGIAKDITDEAKAEEALQKSHDELHKTRSDLLETIRELSTPVLPIHDGVLVVPLVGHMDSQRGSQLSDALLAGIQKHQAETVIIDITGVEIVDTAVASHLIQAVRAAALLGTECVLVGIAPSIARTLVQIGVDFGALTTRRDLQAGVAYALEQREERGEVGDGE